MTDILLKDFESKLDKVIEILREDLATIRTGRVSPEIVAHVKLNVYEGTQVLELDELGTLTTEDAQTILFAPFDVSIIDEIEKGLRKANLRLSIVPEKERIRFKVPPMSEERREEYVILAHKKIEGARIMARQIRKEAMQDIDRQLKNEEISEDEKFRLQKKVQEMVDKTMEEMREIGEAKEKEIRSI